MLCFFSPLEVTMCDAGLSNTILLRVKAAAKTKEAKSDIFAIN